MVRGAWRVVQSKTEINFVFMQTRYIVYIMVTLLKICGLQPQYSMRAVCNMYKTTFFEILTFLHITIQGRRKAHYQTLQHNDILIN
jgi:hypothetical protein